MNEATIIDHARRIAKQAISDIDYSMIYEDDELANEGEDTWEAVLDMIRDHISVSIVFVPVAESEGGVDDGVGV